MINKEIDIQIQRAYQLCKEYEQLIERLTIANTEMEKLLKAATKRTATASNEATMLLKEESMTIPHTWMIRKNSRFSYN